MSASATARERLQGEPAQFITGEISTFTASSPLSHLSFMPEHRLWDEPMVRFADGADPLFEQYKTVIGSVHLMPREALSEAYGKSPEEMPERLSVISWILPAPESTRASNRRETRVPGRLWSHTRYYGEKFNEALRAHVVELLSDNGYRATAPMIEPYFQRFDNEKGPYSNWSERHVAYAAGHGTFSLSDGFITERGIAHRCGSVTTDLELPVSPRTAKDHYANCLFYVDGSCRACIERCPAGAISEQGHDKIRCQAYLAEIGYIAGAIKTYDNEKSVAGCGLCQVKVPCESRNPVKKKGRQP